MTKPKYILAAELYELGLSKWQIARELYNPRNRREHQRAALKVNALLHYYMSRREKLYARRDYMQGEIMFDQSGGVRNTEQWRPLFDHPSPADKQLLPYEEQVRADLEEVLYYFHQDLNISYELKNVTWGMVKWANNKLYKVYGRRTGGKLASARYPKLLAYIYTVYFVALHMYYPHILRKVKKVIAERLNKRYIKLYHNYLQEFMRAAGEVLAQQHTLQLPQ